MRHFNLVVFNDTVPDQATHAYFSRVETANALGAVDQLAFQAVVDTADAIGGTLIVGVQHSGDGRNWVEKTTSTATIDTLPFSHVVFQNGVAPQLALVRVRLALQDATSSALVRVFATGRDVV